MKLKTFSLTGLIAGIVFTAIGLLLPIIYAVNADIIGGADYLTSFRSLNLKLNGLLYILDVTSFCFFLTGIFCLVFSKAVIKHCRIRSTVYSFCLSALGGTGIACVFLVMLSSPTKNPITYPSAFTMGMLCLFLFIYLLYAYVVFRIKNVSVIGVIIDIITSVIYLPTFFLIFNFVINITTSIKDSIFG